MLPRDLNPFDPLYAGWLNELKSAVIADLIGDKKYIQVMRTGAGATISFVGRIPGTSPIRRFRITGSSRDGSYNRWTYTGTEVYKDSAGYGGWSDVPDGLEDATLYSITEDQQTGSVTAGNVNQDLADYPAGFDRRPLANGTRVYAVREVLSDGAEEWWIINAGTDHDGTCEAEEEE